MHIAVELNIFFAEYFIQNTTFFCIRSVYEFRVDLLIMDTVTLTVFLLYLD